MRTAQAFSFSALWRVASKARVFSLAGMWSPRSLRLVVGAGLVAAAVVRGQVTPATGVWNMRADAFATWDSSLFGDATGVEGWEFTLTPRIAWLRRGTNVGFRADAGVVLRRFEPDIGQDGAGPFAEALLDWKRVPWSGEVAAGFSGGSRIDDLLRRRVLSERLRASTALAYALGPRWSLEGGAAWRREDADGEGLGRTEEWSASVRAARALTELLRAYAGYEIGRTTSAGAADPGASRDGAFLFGVDGTLPVQLLPGVTITAQAGYRRRTGRDGGGEVFGGFVGSAEAVWRISPLTRLELGASRSLVTALDGAEGTSTAARVALLHAFHERAAASATATWTRAEFAGRSDGADTWRLGLGVSYRLAAGIDLTLAGETSRVDERAGSSFDRRLVRAGVSWSR